MFFLTTADLSEPPANFFNKLIMLRDNSETVTKNR